MSTPLYDALDEYLSKDFARMHMPGHKGRLREPLGAASRWDVTELPGFESLYHNDDALTETEERYRRLYGTKATLISAGGSTLCIQAMLALACPPGSKVVSARNVHTAAVSAMALLDLHPAWIAPVRDEATGLMLPPSPGAVDYTLQCNPDATAVCLTSPDYYGMQADIAAIAEVCRKFGKPLLVDNAHGAHLAFKQPSEHPAALGADLCCDSLHKTLPVLTGGALLHIQNEAYLQEAKGRMALFGSTSPSYLILLSVDRALLYLESQARDDLCKLMGRLESLRKPAWEKGIIYPPGKFDTARLTLGFCGAGYSREEFLDHLTTHRIMPEYTDSDFCVLLPDMRGDGGDLARVERMLRALSPRERKRPSSMAYPMPEAACSVQKAVFAAGEEIPTELAEGRIAAATIAPCPPGIPLLIPGERIRAGHMPFLKSSGISRLNVVK